MPDLTLPPAISALPMGSVYARPAATENEFTVHVRGLSITATVQQASVGGAWAVQVEDIATRLILATAVVYGTRLRASQQVAGLTAGVALTMGVEPHLPELADLRTQLTL